VSLQTPGPLTQASNKIALILAGNTPFYPLYLWFILGKAGLPWLYLTVLACPFFAVTLLVARRNGLAGRFWLCMVASVNSLYVTWLLGEASGTALFLIPCISLAVLNFRRGEFWPMALAVGLAFIPYFFLHGRFPAAPVLYDARAYHSLLVLNEVSVASITAVLAYLLGRAREESSSFCEQKEPKNFD
jgi:hypothetical protein